MTTLRDSGPRPGRGTGDPAPGRGGRHHQGRRSRHLRGCVHGAGRGQHARRRHGGRRFRRQGRRQEDRDHQGLVGRFARQRRARHTQAGRAGWRESPGRAAVGRRRLGDQGLCQDQARRHLRQRHLGGAGHDAARPGAQFLPLLHRRGAMDGRPGRLRLQRPRAIKRSRRWPKTIRSRTRRCSASWRRSARPAVMSRRNSGYRSAPRTSPRSSPRCPTISTRSMSCSAAPTRSTSSPSINKPADRRRWSAARSPSIRPILGIQGQDPRRRHRHAVRRPDRRRQQLAGMAEVRCRLQEATRMPSPRRRCLRKATTSI